MNTVINQEGLKMKIKNNYYLRSLVSCAIKLENEGGISGIDSIRELILYINRTMDIPKLVKVKLDDIDTMCLISGDICRNPEITNKQCEKYYQDIKSDFITVCRNHGILDI